MNLPEARPHLSQDDLLRAVVDRGDLPGGAAAHLEICAPCREQLKRINSRFQRMAQLAAELTPRPTRVIRFGDHGRPERRATRSLWAVGLTAVMVLLFATFWPQTPVEIPPVRPQAVISDRQLLSEVSGLVDNALPAVVREVAAVAAPRPDHDLINWIVPSIEDADQGSL